MDLGNQVLDEMKMNSVVFVNSRLKTKLIIHQTLLHITWNVHYNLTNCFFFSNQVWRLRISTQKPCLFDFVSFLYTEKNKQDYC